MEDVRLLVRESHDSNHAQRLGLEVRSLAQTDGFAPKSGDSYRVSPAFAVERGDLPRPFETCDFRVSFVTCDNTFSAISQLRNNLTSEQAAGLYFSIGLPGVLAFHRTEQETDHILEILNSSFRAHELWRVKAGNVEVLSTSAPVAASFDSAAYLLQRVDEVTDFDILQLLLETQHSVNEVVAKASVHSPTRLPRLGRLVASLNAIIGDVVDLSKQLASADDEAMQRSCQKLVNANVDYLIQINSALAYFYSQAFFGVTPLMSNRCLYQSHAFLGIGGALRTLDNFGSVVSRALEEVPVYDTLKTFAPSVAGFDPGTLRTVNEVVIQAAAFDIDTHLTRAARVSQKHTNSSLAVDLAFRSLRCGKCRHAGALWR